MFRHWTVHARPAPELEERLAGWVARHMQGYGGMMNFETIGGAIIEAHLRFADQWCDLYGEGWVEALVKLYASGRWQFADGNRRDGYSVPLFARHGQRYTHPPAALLAVVRAMALVTSGCRYEAATNVATTTTARQKRCVITGDPPLQIPHAPRQVWPARQEFSARPSRPDEFSS
jgi:hypothetical protein